MLIVTPNFLLQKRGGLKVTMSDTSDLDRQIEQLKRCEIIQEAEVKALCAKAREILVEESNVQRVDSPVTVISKQRYETCNHQSWLLHCSVCIGIEQNVVLTQHNTTQHYE